MAGLTGGEFWRWMQGAGLAKCRGFGAGGGVEWFVGLFLQD
jgi:hypothetical protein